MFPGYLDLTKLTTFLDRSDSVMHLAGTAPRFLEQLDVDGDGVVSLAEWISLWRRTKAEAGVQKTKGLLLLPFRFFSFSAFRFLIRKLAIYGHLIVSNC